MNGKELLLKVDSKKMYEYIVNNIYEKIPYQAVLDTLQDVKNITNITNDKSWIIVCSKYFDTEDGEIVERDDLHYIKIDDIQKYTNDPSHLVQHYSFMFEPWENHLSCYVSESSLNEMGEIAIAANLYFEMTYLAHRYDESLKRIDEETNKLEESMKEYEEHKDEEGYFKSFEDVRELFDDLGIDYEANEYDFEKEKELLKIAAQKNKEISDKNLENLIVEFFQSSN